jgi:hypothetical protein
MGHALRKKRLYAPLEALGTQKTSFAEKTCPFFEPLDRESRLSLKWRESLAAKVLGLLIPAVGFRPSCIASKDSLMSFFSVPALLIPHTGSAFHANPRRVGRRSGAAAVLASIVAIAAAGLTAPASGGMVVSYEDTAGGLKFSYTGSFNYTSAQGGTTVSTEIGSQVNSGSVNDRMVSLNGGWSSVGVYSFSTSVSDLFTQLFSVDNTGNISSGDSFGVVQNIDNNGPYIQFYLPGPYNANSTIQGSAVFPGHTIASTGIQDQVYTFNSGGIFPTDAGLVGDTISFQAVPEPSTWALSAFALACGGWQLTRRRRALREKA